MTRSFMLAVSGFALVSAACTPADDADLDDDMDVAEAEMDNGSVPDGAQSMESLRDDILEDDAMDTANEDAMADEMTDGEMANFGMDYAGLWGTEAQCAEGRAWAFSASSITTPEGEVCSVETLNEGAGQVELTATCTSEDGTETGQRMMTLALQDNGSLSVMDTAEVTVQRCGSFEDMSEPEMEDDMADETEE